jgi:hypothetical protein
MGFGPGAVGGLKAQGLQGEIIAWKLRLFVPVTPEAPARLEPHRVFRRLLILEGWSHDQAYSPVFS